VPGTTLAEHTAQGAIPLEEALAIARQIAEALKYAHERGIVHRDLKPANIKVTPEGRVKVLDFGLPKAMTGDAGAADPKSSPTTGAIGVLGAPLRIPWLENDSRAGKDEGGTPEGHLTAIECLKTLTAPFDDHLIPIRLHQVTACLSHQETRDSAQGTILDRQFHAPEVIIKDEDSSSAGQTPAFTSIFQNLLFAMTAVDVNRVETVAR
jgi:serine/threonine protein kinase